MWHSKVVGYLIEGISLSKYLIGAFCLTKCLICSAVGSRLLSAMMTRGWQNNKNLHVISDGDV
jgi:hypothetical protein